MLWVTPVRTTKFFAAQSRVFVAAMTSVPAACLVLAAAWPANGWAFGGKLRREWKLQQTTQPGVYELHILETADGSIWGSSRRMGTSQIEGLGPDGLGTDQEDVTLRFRRDAGTLIATGSVRNGRGQGTFDIELDPAYASELERRGAGRPDAAQQKHLLFADVPLAFLDDLTACGYEMPDVELLVRCADHGVDRTFVRGMADAGYRLAGIEALIHARDHGVDPEYIRALAAAGYPNVRIEDLLRARDHGVNDEFVHELAAAGITDLDLGALVRARDHGVDGDFLAEMRSAGYGGLSIEQAIRARDHGVDGRFAAKIRRRAGRHVSLEELIRARDSGG